MPLIQSTAVLWSRGEGLPWQSSGEDSRLPLQGCGSVPGWETKIPHARRCIQKRKKRRRPRGERHGENAKWRQGPARVTQLRAEHSQGLMSNYGFPEDTVVKNLPANAGATRDLGLIPGSGRAPAGRNGNPLQYSRLEISMDRKAWRATVPGSHNKWNMTERLSMRTVWNQEEARKDSPTVSL